MVSEPEAVTKARAAFNASCGVWSRDDASDLTLTVKRGEAVMLDAIPLICALEDALAETLGR